MILNVNITHKARVLDVKDEQFKGLKTPLITAINQCPEKHILVSEMLKENGLNLVVEARDDKTFTVYTLKGARVLSYLDAFFNGRKLIKYLRRQEA